MTSKRYVPTCSFCKLGGHRRDQCIKREQAAEAASKARVTRMRELADAITLPSSLGMPHTTLQRGDELARLVLEHFGREG